MSPRNKRIGSLLVAGVLLAGTCGVVPVAQAARPQVNLTTYTIGISLPYLELKELSDGIQRGVQVAVNQANASHLVPGATFKIEPLDDTINGAHSGAKDANNGLQFINNPSVIGEVGPLNSGAAQVSMPVYNQNGLVQISPANTFPGLTDPKFRGKYEPSTAANPVANPITYFRTCSTDIFQGHGDANYAKKIGVKTVFVTDNQGTYGIGLAGYFKEQAIKDGLTVLGYAELDAHNIASSAQSLAASIAAKKPDLVFFGGEYSSAGGGVIFADALKKAGVKALYMGGDGIYANDFIKSSSAGGADGALASNPGPDATASPAAAAFVKAEARMFPGTTPAAYDVYAIDAANVILHAFARAVADGKLKVGSIMDRSKRLIIERYVATTKDYKGASGTVTFDANGDVLSPVFSIYKVVGGKWVFQAIAPQTK
jgi:branched-chain amino acid transport system substrate-binding protein